MAAVFGGAKKTSGTSSLAALKAKQSVKSREAVEEKPRGKIQMASIFEDKEESKEDNKAKDVPKFTRQKP
jgi:hypothetical protein